LRRTVDRRRQAAKPRSSEPPRAPLLEAVRPTEIAEVERLIAAAALS
jgi:hypothetical protein